MRNPAYPTKAELALKLLGQFHEDHPAQQLAQLAEKLTEQHALAPSEKHMIGRDLGRMEPTPSLKYKAAA